MLKRLFLCLTCSIVFLVDGKAQMDKIMPYGGFTYQFISFRAKTSPDVDIFPFYGLSAGFNYVLMHSNDMVSLSASPNLNFSFSFSSFFGTSLLVQTPIFLVARLGAGSTSYNESKFGIGAGVGANYSYVFLQNGGFQEIKQGFVNPSAMVEVNLQSRVSDYTIRFNWSLARPTHELVPGYEAETGSTGISIIYSF